MSTIIGVIGVGLLFAMLGVVRLRMLSTFQLKTIIIIMTICTLVLIGASLILLYLKGLL
jgi:hypothetical protein